MSLSMIALNKLIPSASNVRKTGGRHIEELAANIAAIGLLQNLTVRATDNGKYEVIAGGRRLAALRRLAKDKQITKSHPVSCRILDDENDTEISLAENTIRQAMHPADQYEAFKELADRDQMSAADIAARFGCPEAHVSKLLKLGRVSPVLLAAYRKETLDLEALMAFAISDDHAQQEEVFENLQKGRGLHARNIRRLLTETKLSTSDRRARFIGITTYVESGGTITHDLFAEAGEGYLDHPILLYRLVAERLEKAAADILAEGWKWVEYFPEDFPSLYDQKTYKRAPIGSEPDPKNKAATGVLIGLTSDGELRVETGMLRKGDRLPGSPIEAKPKPVISAALLEDITAHRTQAFRAAVANDSSVAFDMLVYSMALDEFTYSEGAILNVRRQSSFLGERVEATVAGEASDRMKALWEATVPTEADALWNWIRQADRDTKDNLLAYLCALTIDVRQTGGKDVNPHSHHVQEALRLDMADYWRPTAANYFFKIRREQLLEAMHEAQVIEAGETFSAAKKTELAMIAERLIGATRWLPKQLRLPEPIAPEVEDYPEEERMAA